MSNGNPYSSPESGGAAMPPDSGRKGAWRFRLIELLVVVGIVVIVVGLLLPVRRTAGGAARRTQCANNLKQIGLALHNYADANGGLPPAYTVDAEGKPLHSWRTLILPYMEQQALFDKIDLTKPWDDPANKAAFETAVSTYRCPSAVGPAINTTYLAVAAPGGCFRPTEPRPLSEIIDGLNSTLMVVEVTADQAVHWMSPADASEQTVLAMSGAASSPHQGGAQTLMADGGIFYVSAETTTPKQLKALISIAGGDNDDSMPK